MNSIKRLIFIFVICISNLVYAEIYTASSVEQINNTLLELLAKRNPEKTLAILPLEGFILKPANPEFYTKNKNFRALISKAVRKAKSSKSVYFKELVLTEYEQQLSDTKIVEFFKNIQQYNMPFIVVTRNFSGSFNKIPYLEVWTWSYLFKKGIDLSKSPLGEKQILFNRDHKKVNGSYPTLYRGLLSCNNVGQKNSPQSIIASLLAVDLKWIPDVVYIVDSNEDYIKSLEQQFKSLRSDIQVVGFVFSPKYAESAQVSPQKLLKFWEELVDKLNSVSRNVSNQNGDNPYE